MGTTSWAIDDDDDKPIDVQSFKSYQEQVLQGIDLFNEFFGIITIFCF